jgi:hypothetical protein
MSTISAQHHCGKVRTLGRNRLGSNAMVQILTGVVGWLAGVAWLMMIIAGAVVENACGAVRRLMSQKLKPVQRAATKSQSRSA